MAKTNYFLPGNMHVMPTPDATDTNKFISESANIYRASPTDTPDTAESTVIQIIENIPILMQLK